MIAPEGSEAIQKVVAQLPRSLDCDSTAFAGPEGLAGPGQPDAIADVRGLKSVIEIKPSGHLAPKA
jgi:hypothetical protein